MPFDLSAVQTAIREFGFDGWLLCDFRGSNPLARRILGLPVTALIVIGGALIVLLTLGSVVIPRARRRRQARGGGSY